jgi:hypothetical protein
VLFVTVSFDLKKDLKRLKATKQTRTEVRVGKELGREEGFIHLSSIQMFQYRKKQEEKPVFQHNCLYTLNRRKYKAKGCIIRSEGVSGQNGPPHPQACTEGQTPSQGQQQVGSSPKLQSCPHQTRAVTKMFFKVKRCTALKNREAADQKLRST